MCRMKSGGVGNALILAIAFCNVPITSLFASLLNPMWLSLICAKLKSAADRRSRCAEQLRREHAAADRPKHAGAGPGHAFEKAAAIDAVGIVVM